jgi:hypothetical protein
MLILPSALVIDLTDSLWSAAGFARQCKHDQRRYIRNHRIKVV